MRHPPTILRSVSLDISVRVHRTARWVFRLVVVKRETDERRRTGHLSSWKQYHSIPYTTVRRWWLTYRRRHRQWLIDCVYGRCRWRDFTWNYFGCIFDKISWHPFDVCCSAGWRRSKLLQWEDKWKQRLETELEQVSFEIKNWPSESVVEDDAFDASGEAF